MITENINVILCCYQGESYIAEQLDSILAQTYPSVEIFVSDDSSNDKTQAIVESYCANFSNVTLHNNTENLGFLKNFEVSLLRIKGKYFALCDQDDIWHPDKLTVSMSELKKIEAIYPNKPILVHTDLELMDAHGHTIEGSFFTKKELSLSNKKSLGQILGHCGIMGNTILMNRILVDKALPFPEGLKYHDYWLAVINELYGVRKTISKPLVKYRLHDTNTSSNNILKKNIVTLPFSQDNRVVAIKYLLANYDIPRQDKLFITRFYSYLIFKKDRFYHFIFLLRNGFFKSNLFYRINSFFRIMTAKYK